MKIEKETTTKYNEYYCDICKEKTVYDNTELTVEDEDNYNYGDCYYRKTYNYDICQNCLRNKIFPYIRELAEEEPRIEVSEG